jgi:hypothetical protein
LSGQNSHRDIAVGIIDYLKQQRKFIDREVIVLALRDEHGTNETLIRSLLNALSEVKILDKKELLYKYGSLTDEEIEEEMSKMFADANDLPSDVLEYYKQYGFQELVKSVAKQINHDDIVVREFDEDRLWTGRYIDFLEKAKEYVEWFKADQSIARQKISRIKKQSK